MKNRILLEGISESVSNEDLAEILRQISGFSNSDRVITTNSKSSKDKFSQVTFFLRESGEGFCIYSISDVTREGVVTSGRRTIEYNESSCTAYISALVTRLKRDGKMKGL